MKRLSLFLLTVLFSITVFGASGKCGKNLKWYYDSRTKTLSISGSGAMDDYSSEYDSKKGEFIYKIPWKKFRKDITTVILPEGLTYIGKEAFEDCEKVSYCKIPSTVVTIGNGAFAHTCITRVVIPDGVEKIGRSAFSRCYSLTSIYIPASVTEIGGWIAFAASKLTSFQVDPNNPNYCSVNGVLFNKAKTTLIQYPAGLPYPNYVVPEGVQCIEEIAFYRCENLVSVQLPNSLTTIKHSAFEYCEKLESVVIPPSVQYLEHETFGSCYKLSSVTFSEGLTSIGSKAFEYCKSLYTVEIPRSVTKIADDAFMKCPNIRLVKASYREEKPANQIAQQPAKAAPQQAKVTQQSAKKAQPAKQIAQQNTKQVAQQTTQTEAQQTPAKTVQPKRKSFAIWGYISPGSTTVGPSYNVTQATFNTYIKQRK